MELSQKSQSYKYLFIKKNTNLPANVFAVSSKASGTNGSSNAFNMKIGIFICTQKLKESYFNDWNNGHF